MSTKTLSAVVGLLVSAGYAAANDVDYTATPLIDWHQENRMLDQCTALGKLGTPTCKFDEESFTKHYQRDKPKKPGERDRAFPHDYCQGAVSMLNGNQASSSFHNALVADGPSKAFKSRVRAITCVYDDDPKTAPTLKLSRDTLIITMRWHSYEDPIALVRDNDWYIRDLAKIFPEFKTEWLTRNPSYRFE